MPLPNPDHVKALIALINQGPYLQLLSMRLCEITPGYARLSVELERKHLNPFGVTHGGVFSSIIDTVAYWAVYFHIEENAGLTTIDLSVDNLAPVKEGSLIAEAKLLKAGRSICLAEAMVSDHKGRRLAHGKSKQMVTPGLQSMAQAVAALGYPPLPAKFLAKEDSGQA